LPEGADLVEERKILRLVAVCDDAGERTDLGEKRPSNGGLGKGITRREQPFLCSRMG
jgi:hypothetical protein